MLLVPPARLERAAFALGTRCSFQLSYGDVCMEGATGLEPAVELALAGLKVRCLQPIWTTPPEFLASRDGIEPPSSVLETEAQPLDQRDTLLEEALVGVRGFEPPTPCAQGRCATRLRYTPPKPPRHTTNMAGAEGVEPSSRESESRIFAVRPHPNTTTGGGSWIRTSGPRFRDPCLAGRRLGPLGHPSNCTLAGPEGVEPSLAGIKIRCLTTWLHPYEISGAAYECRTRRFLRDREASSPVDQRSVKRWRRGRDSNSRSVCRGNPLSRRALNHSATSPYSAGGSTGARTRTARIKSPLLCHSRSGSAIWWK